MISQDVTTHIHPGVDLSLLFVVKRKKWRGPQVPRAQTGMRCVAPAGAWFMSPFTFILREHRKCVVLFPLLHPGCSRSFSCRDSSWKSPDQWSSLWKGWVRGEWPAVVQEMGVRFLDWEDSTYYRATKPLSHNYSACALQMLKFTCLEPLSPSNKKSHNDKPMCSNIPCSQK